MPRVVSAAWLRKNHFPIRTSSRELADQFPEFFRFAPRPGDGAGGRRTGRGTATRSPGRTTWPKASARDKPKLCHSPHYHVHIDAWSRSGIENAIRRDGREDSVGLFGSLEGDTITIRRVCGPGGAERTWNSAAPDIAYFQLHERAHGVPWVGDIHTHPDGERLVEPSGSDMHCWHAGLADVRGSVYVGLIGQADHARAPIRWHAWTASCGEDGQTLIEPARLTIERSND